MYFCRVCESLEGLTNLMDHQGQFQAITGLHVSSNDATALICSNCLECLSSAYNFQQQALATDSKLQTLGFSVKVEPEIKDEPIVPLQSPVASLDVKDDDESDVEKEKKDAKCCPYCLRWYFRKDEQTACIKAHIEENGGLECDLCHKKYATKHVLLAHLKNMHLKYAERVYKCLDCNREFKTAFNFRDHQRIVHFKGEQYP